MGRDRVKSLPKHLKTIWRGFLTFLMFCPAIAFGMLCIFLKTPQKNDAELLVEHQNEVAAFISMAKNECTRPHNDAKQNKELLNIPEPKSTYFEGIYTDEDNDQVLHGQLLDGEYYEKEDLPVSAELQSAWQRIYKKAFKRRFDTLLVNIQENGALIAYFDTASSWTKYEEGHYRTIHGIVWVENGYLIEPKSYWVQLTQEDGILPSSEGKWYTYAHRQYDG